MKTFILVVVVFLASTLVESKEFKEAVNQKSDPIFESRIIGGSTAADTAYPYQARLSMYGTLLVLPVSLGQCGGSIIGLNWVLTAAHCLDDQPGPLGTPTPVAYVTVEAGGGATTIFRQSQTVQSENFIKNPEYDPTTPRFRYNDVALLMTGAWDFDTPYVKAIKLPQPATDINLYTGKTAIATGYGPTSYDNPDGTSSTLQYIELIILSNTQCYPQFGNDMPTSAYCAQDPRPPPKGSVCNKDFGGPLALTENGETTLIGVGSILHYIAGCDGTAQGFQMVAKLMSWITSVTGLTA